MKYCTKCGHQLIDEARFCNACGAPAVARTTQAVNSENPYANAQQVYEVQPAPVYTNEPKTEEQLRAEEQAVLDKFSLGLKHERLCWKIGGIFYLVGAIFFIAAGLIFGIMAVDSDAYVMRPYSYMQLCIMYIFGGLVSYLPVAIINLVMKKRLEKYRAKLYTDCRDGIGHYSVGSIVFAAFFNNIALIFIIIYFIQTKTDKSVIDRIKANQDSYNSQT